MKKLIIVLLMMLALVFSTTAALPTVDTVKINGDVVENDDTLKINLGETLKIKVKVKATTDVDNIVLTTELLGDERNMVRDQTRVFDLDANETDWVETEVRIPKGMGKDDYDLRVIVGTRTDAIAEYRYRLRIRGDRHDIDVLEVTPLTEPAKAGKLVTIAVEIRNNGRVEEDGKVKVCLGGYGVCETDFFTINESDKEIVEVQIEIPQLEENAVIDLTATAEYDEGYSEAVGTGQLLVIGNPVVPEEMSQEEAKVIFDTTDRLQSLLEQGAQPAPVENPNKQLINTLYIILLIVGIIFALVGIIVLVKVNFLKKEGY
jgi:hypothetical protein